MFAVAAKAPLDLRLYTDYFSRSNWAVAKKDFARVTVYFAHSNLVTTEEMPDYHIFQLISDIGGQLGVWVVMSVITMSETLALFFHLVRNVCRNLIRRRRRDSHQGPEAV